VAYDSHNAGMMDTRESLDFAADTFKQGFVSEEHRLHRRRFSSFGM
jgi:hypothetical protein